MKIYFYICGCKHYFLTNNAKMKKLFILTGYPTHYRWMTDEQAERFSFCYAEQFICVPGGFTPMERKQLAHGYAVVRWD